MAATFKALSALLSYPTTDLQAVQAEIMAAIRVEGLVERGLCRDLEAVSKDLALSDLFDLQERYVDLFDKTRRLSLHLFEHVHGESRDRGQAMVDLARLYETGGLTLAANELPDYLPLFLEYLSTRPLEEAQGTLANALPIIAALEERLARRHAGYAAVLAAIRSAAGARDAGVTADLAAEPEDDGLAALDAAWEETAVAFGPGDSFDGCSVDRLKTRMRASRRDARPAQP